MTSHNLSGSSFTTVLVAAAVILAFFPQTGSAQPSQEALTLEKAVQLKPNDDQAMVYINLLYRQMAEFEPDGHELIAHLKTADEWGEKALNARKAPAPAPTAATTTTE